MDLFTLGGILSIVGGLLLFRILFKCIDWFDKI